MKLYLDRLPKHPGLTKLNAAVLGYSPHPPTIPIHFISPDNLEMYFPNLPPWLRGMSSVGGPNEIVQRYIDGVRAPEVYETLDVALMSIGEVITAGGACRTLLLKVDVEGHDPNLLVGYADFLWRNKECYADVIQFEAVNSPADLVAAAQKALITVGYSECGHAPDGGGGEDDTLLCYNRGADARFFWASRIHDDTAISKDTLSALFSTGTGPFDIKKIPKIEFDILDASMQQPQDCPWPAKTNT